MLIGIDCRLWKQTGVGRYTQNLVENLSLIDNKNKYILFARSVEIQDLKKVVSKKFKVINCDFKWHSVEEQTEFAFFLNKYKLDLVHFPYFSVPYLYRKKYVVTVHDLIINKFNTGTASTLPYPIYKIKRLGYNFVLRNAILKSVKIIVPSRSVKSDLLSVYKNIPPEKIEVTYEGGFEKEYKDKKPKIIEDYLLRVGNFYPHKNIENLLIAFKNISNKKIKLVMVGKKDFFYKTIEEKIKKLNLERRIIFVNNPSDSSLYSLFKNAKATVVPSFMEGFSLTAVEAMSVGCPVILSDIPVHKEICKDAGIYFNPNNTEDITQKINEFLSIDQSGMNNLKSTGVNTARDYSWKKMAAQTLHIYESSSSTSSE